MNVYILKRPGDVLMDPFARAPYDSFVGAVVIAPDEETARSYHPDGKKICEENNNTNFFDFDDFDASDWIDPNDVEVVFIGTAADDMKEGVIMMSYRHG